jgi:3-deoxy-manno-octulosonate cytidylyltransferase (CMP-KDO synthetase)
MSVLAVIPARLGATRLPRKPLRLLAGEPLIVRVYQRVVALGVADLAVVATDHPDILRVCAAGAVAIVASGRAAIGTASVPIAAEALRTPDVVKVVCTEDGRALYFSRAPIPFLRDPAEAPLLQSLARQHVGVYAYTREALQAWVAWAPHPLELVERLEQLRPLAHGLAIGVAMVPAAEGGIDTEDDLTRANARWNTLTLPALS